MTTESDYRIYITPPLGYSELPFIVTVAGSNLGYPSGQWLLHIPTAQEPLYVGRFKFEYANNLYPELDGAALHEHLLSDAIAFLRRHLIEHQASVASSVALQDIPLKRDSFHLFAGLHYRGVCPAVLNALRSRCDSSELREILRTITSQWPPEVSRE
jgi:hypothetical protein